MEKYVVSARKYRPTKFQDVVGQDHVTTTLQNAVKNNKDFETADAIRDQLLELGVEINDSSDGTEWKLKS